MINKLYDFRDVAIPDALLNASVSREEIDGELRLTAQRFTTIAPAFDGICNARNYKSVIYSSLSVVFTKERRTSDSA